MAAIRCRWEVGVSSKSNRRESDGNSESTWNENDGNFVGKPMLHRIEIDMELAWNLSDAEEKPRGKRIGIGVASEECRREYEVDPK